MIKDIHKTIFENMPNPAMVLDTSLVFVEANAAYCRAVRKRRSELIGHYVFDAITESPDFVGAAKQNFEKTLAGEMVQLDALPFQIQSMDGLIEERILQVSQFPIRCAEGKVEFIVQRFVDVTEREKLRTERDLVTAELNHRVRNTLSVVSAVAEQTGLATQDYESFLESFQGRLAAIGRNFAALSESHWQGLDFERIIRAEFEPYAGPVLDRIRIDGPALTMSVKATKDTSMLLHELITNASKYGFLSRQDGRLSLWWDVVDGWLSVNWHESGMDGIKAPDRTGFGFQLFEMMPNIHVEKEFASDGLKLKVEIPVNIVADEVSFRSR